MRSQSTHTHALQNGIIPVHLALQVGTKGVGLDIAGMPHHEIELVLSGGFALLLTKINSQSNLLNLVGRPERLKLVMCKPLKTKMPTNQTSLFPSKSQGPVWAARAFLTV